MHCIARGTAMQRIWCERTLTIVTWCADDSSGRSLMRDEYPQQQQQQPDRSSKENCLPEWKSSDPILASILRHLRATDQRLDGSEPVISNLSGFHRKCQWPTLAVPSLKHRLERKPRTAALNLD